MKLHTKYKDVGLLDARRTTDKIRSQKLTLSLRDLTLLLFFKYITVFIHEAFACS